MAADEKLVADFAGRLLQEGYAVWHEYPDSHDEPDLDAARNLLAWLAERGRLTPDGAETTEQWRPWSDQDWFWEAVERKTPDWATEYRLPDPGPVVVEWRWALPPFRAYFTQPKWDGGTYPVGVCRWTPWAARRRAEQLRDAAVRPVLRLGRR